MMIPGKNGQMEQTIDFSKTSEICCEACGGKTFRIEHKDYVDNPTLTITLHNPPYDDETILSRTKWKVKDVTITEINHGEIK